MFKSLVEKILRENNINPNTYAYRNNEIEERSYDELLKIFGLKESIKETKDDQTIIWLARKIYKQFLEKIQLNQYENIAENIYEINIDDLTIDLVTNSTDYNLSTYDNNTKSIEVITQFKINDILNISEDYLLKSNLIHEITHYLTANEDDNSLPWNYNDPSIVGLDYYTQDPEKQSNKAAICDFIISFIKNNIQQTLNAKSLYDTQSLQIYIDKMLTYFVNTDGVIYHSFFKALSKDEKAFKEFYTDIVMTCIEYINKNFEECCYISSYNYLSENINKL